jgi:hypothetical protein
MTSGSVPVRAATEQNTSCSDSNPIFSRGADGLSA